MVEGPMYDSISDFLQTLSAEHRVLWAALVLGVIATLALALYGLWEVALRLALKLVSRLVRSGPRSRQTHPPGGRAGDRS